MKKSILFAIILGLFLSPELAAQNPGDTLWTNIYGGVNEDKGWCVQQTSDDGYVIVGISNSYGAGGYDIYLVKTDAAGDILWTRTYGKDGSDDGRCVRQTADDGYIIAGNTQPIGIMGSYIWLLKTDSSGDTLWTNRWGEVPIPNINTGRCVQLTSDGGYIISGHVQFLGTNNEDACLIKTDDSGDTEWIESYGGTGYEVGYWTQQTSDNGYIVVGYTTSFGSGNEDVYLVKTNASGDTLWTRTYGGEYTDSGYSVQQTSDDGYIIAGFTDSFGAGSYDVYLIKTDAAGDTVWTRTYGGTEFDKGYSVQQIDDGTYIISGTARSFSAGGDGDVYLLHVDMSGDTLWTRTYEGLNDQRGWSVQQTSDKSFIVAGFTGVYGNSDYYLPRIQGDVTGIGADYHFVPTIHDFLRNEPNPFSMQTTISFSISQASMVSLSIYNISGQLVTTLVANEYHEGGNHSLQWDGRGLNGSPVSNGIYFCRLNAGEFNQVYKMVMLR